MEEPEEEGGKGSSAGDSYEACRERLRVLHNMREWILKDASSSGIITYDLYANDEKLEKYYPPSDLLPNLFLLFIYFSASYLYKSYATHYERSAT